MTEINQEAGGITATLNSDNTITLSNTTGNDIVIGGNAPTDAGFTAGTYLGYLKLENVDGTFVKIEAMTKANGYASNSGNIDDLARFGFNEVGSRRSGRPVATLQKAQARVQTDPRIIMVACFCAQHSPIFGQAASSHTVTRLCSRISERVSAYSADTGALTRSHSGRRGCGRSGLRRFSGWRSAPLLVLTCGMPVCHSFTFNAVSYHG